MTDLSPEKQKLSQLIVLAIEGNIDSRQTEELNELLLSSPDLQTYFLDYTMLVAVIRRTIDSYTNINLSGELDLDAFQEVIKRDIEDSTIRATLAKEAENQQLTRNEKQASVRGQQQQRIPNRREFITALGKIAAVILFVTLVIWADRKLWQSMNKPQVSPEIVAQITESLGAVWDSDDEGFDSEDGLIAGPRTLLNGIAVLTFAKGAEVILEGPAAIHLYDGNHMKLLRGRLSATVHPEAIGFRIDTPTTRVLDLGTEFGVVVHQSVVSEIHVFEGEVALYPGMTQNRVSVRQGQARSIGANHQVREIHMSQASFVRRQELTARQLAGRGNAYHRWLAGSYELRRHPNLVLYFPFEKEDIDEATVLNRSAGFASQMNGQIHSEDDKAISRFLTRGRWPEKGAFAFGQDGQAWISVLHHEALNMEEELTLAAWIFVEDRYDGGVLLSKGTPATPTNRFPMRTFQFSYFLEDGALIDDEYSHHNKIQFFTGNSKNEQVLIPILPKLGEWFFFALSYKQGHVCCYLNERLIGDLQIADKLLIATEYDLQIGRDNPSWNTEKGKNEDYLFFDGLMDELMIFNKALSKVELNEIFYLGMMEN